MKSLILGLIVSGLFFTNLASASMSYECSRYVAGEYKGYIKVSANNRKEAEKKAYLKYKNELDMKVDRVKCK